MRPYTMRMSPPFTMMLQCGGGGGEQAPELLQGSDHHHPGRLGRAGDCQPGQDGQRLPRADAGRDHACSGPR